MKHGEQVSLLEQKNKALSNQLDKVTADLFKMQEVAADLSNSLESKKHSEQLAGWAIDRAIEVGKFSGSGITNTESVIAAAKQFCEWIKSSYIEPEVQQPRETMQ